MEKIRCLVTATKEYMADKDQYWVLSQRGGSYMLWQESKKDMLRLIHRLSRKKVLWVIPFK